MNFDVWYVLQEIIHSTNALCIVADSTTRSLTEMEKWRYTTKDEMKHLGGTLIQMDQKMREFLILGISKMVEDSFNNLAELESAEIKVWDSSVTPAAYSKEVRLIRHLGNVIKHNNSFISVASGSRSCRDLVVHFGCTDETPIWHLPDFSGRTKLTDMLRYVYYAYHFCFGVLHLRGHWPHVMPTIAHDDIPEYMLEKFVRNIPGHPHSVEAE